MTWYGPQFGMSNKLMLTDRFPGLTWQAKGLCSMLASHADKDTGRCFPSNWKLAEEMGCDERQIKRLLKVLVKAEWIVRFPDPDTRFRNWVTVLQVPPRLLRGGTEDPPGVVISTTPEVVIFTPHNRPVEPDQFHQTSQVPPDPSGREEGTTMGNPRLLGQAEDYDSQESASDLAPDSTVEPKARVKKDHAAVGTYPWLFNVHWPAIMADAGVLANEYSVGHLRGLVSDLHKERGLSYFDIGRLMTAWSLYEGTNLQATLDGKKPVAVFHAWTQAKGRIMSVLAAPAEYVPVADDPTAILMGSQQ